MRKIVLAIVLTLAGFAFDGQRAEAYRGLGGIRGAARVGARAGLRVGARAGFRIGNGFIGNGLVGNGLFGSDQIILVPTNQAFLTQQAVGFQTIGGRGTGLIGNGFRR
jgi:hypothetical protein